ncbi:MAG: beta-ketoacyl-ACP synthase III [Gammaproteobacteria bacterium]|nr:MAG: beta-ketoacyl-ACP synthase III [Gammaproteobacteria bacterium]
MRRSNSIMNDVYLTALGSFLPNAPVNNDEIENLLGMVGGKPSRARRLTLRNNGIQTRYYAIDPDTGEFTHNNAQLAAEAIRVACKCAGMSLDDIECLCAGTSSPDQIKPAHANMVHGELGSTPMEVVSTAGVCTSSMMAMKYAYMSIVTGAVHNAVSVGSELSSSFMRAENFEPEIEARIEALEKRPELAFEKDFLRWMLSDGAGAAMLRSEPSRTGPSLHIDWIDGLSFAGDMPVCMYSGAIMQENGTLQGWRAARTPAAAIAEGYFAVKQDARLLDEHVLPATVDRALIPIASKHNLTPDDVTWFLPHYSSEYFRPRLYERMKQAGFEIPEERWFTNLTRVGNVGSASIYLVIEELLNSGKLKSGDRLLCYIPESARFSIYYMLLTVV